MKKISKTDSARVWDLKSKLEDVSTEVNAKMKELEDLVNQTNETRQELYNVLDDVHRQAEEYYDERSDKWKEGDAGEAYYEWLSELELYRDKFDTDFNFDWENPFEELAEELDELPEEPST